MKSSSKKVPYNLVLITGASSGIGAATAEKLAAEGLRVVLAARRRERLEEIAAQIRAAGGSVEVFCADLTRPEEREALVEFVHQLGELDVLINNAGFGWHGWFDEMGWKLAEEMLQINIEAAVHLTSAFLPGMLARRRGHIIFLGSIAGDIPSRGVGLYSATKAFVNALTTGLYRETRGSGVQVSIVKPGAVRTEFFITGKSRPAGTTIPAEGMGVKTERVVQAVWSLLRRPRRAVYVPGVLVLTQWFALLFGWMMDLLGPVFMPGRGRS